jgi:putative hemolysin
MERSLVSALESAYPVDRGLLPAGPIHHGHYEVGYARNIQELDEILRLRFDVFNLELGEGLDASHETGRDLDDYDPQCHHLYVRDARSGRVVGTYRMQTDDMARRARGFYSAVEYDLSACPEPILASVVEIGRACIEREHRNQWVLFLLWRGLAAYMSATGKRFLFGCCSLTSQHLREGWSVYRQLGEAGHLHPSLCLAATPAYSCRGDAELATQLPVKVPKLFRTYLRFGATVCSEPALDRHFKTIDFLVLFDVGALAPRSRALFFV